MKASCVKASLAKAVMKSALKKGGPCTTTKQVQDRVKALLKEGKLKKSDDLKKSMALKKAGKGKAALKGLQTMSLQDKVTKALEGAETEEQAALLLKQSLTKLEHSRVWNQHNLHLKHHPVDATGDAKTKGEKGLASALWFVQQGPKKFISMQMSMDAEDRVLRNDAWVSEKMMLDRFGADELQRHLNSGRVLWKQDPWTKDVWQYKDQGDISRTQVVGRSKKLNFAQEYEADVEQEDWFKEIFDQD